ncbi:GDSL esterase/lipase At4g10955-like [Juglans microcarpa x Juglans regia]|uniref:GDSL esterase/lipase At4g10955-like n=1 Tax=Juglans microcarpa x Juglans regia TaxID=2249226 RepID=UPI001B7F0DCA|nr:GDSL esterase/lipase At4g10955-like [Juglans microcarpa x Juglans regia]XP_041009669.1 GDSL esterase/lipase At4g10955-like [Juglans microcarpa x Juglans regia]
MFSNNEIFHETGPKHLTAMDWKNTDYQRSVVASLVQGVYSLERDRQRKNLGRYREGNAEPWWTSFNFHLDEPLIDGKCIFGAIYKYNGKYASADSDVPEYVIAFRGTLLMPETVINDITLDFKCFLNKLEESPRFKRALYYVKRFVEANGARNVWLAGHSLGSAIALLVGKKMILTMEWFPKAYLFNPPFLSFPIELLEDEKVKKGIRCVHRMVKAGLISLAAELSKPRMEDHFALLSSWTPHLFVNPADIFCAAYIAYFERKVGAGETMTLAENNSMRNLVSHVVFRTDLKDATHLLPSAHLIVNESHPNKKAADNSSCSDFLEAHKISQWWRPDVSCQSTLYDQYR